MPVALTAAIASTLVPMRAAVYWGKGDLRVEEIPVPEIGAGEMAAWAGTISYEVVCRVGARVPREYRAG